MVEAIENGYKGRPATARYPHPSGDWGRTLSRTQMRRYTLGQDIDVTKAKDLFTQADAAYKAGNFTEAGKLYEESYFNAPRPELLFDAAQAWRQAGDVGRSVIFYKQYIGESPTGKPADDARAWLAKLDKQPVQSKSIWGLLALVGLGVVGLVLQVKH